MQEKNKKGLAMEFIENGIQAKIDELFNYRMCFYDFIHDERLENTFNVYTSDLSQDGYDLMSKGIKKFYPENCDTEYINEVNEWYYKVEDCLFDFRIELMRNYNIKNPFISVLEYIEKMK